MCTHLQGIKLTKTKKKYSLKLEVKNFNWSSTAEIIVHQVLSMF